MTDLSEVGKILVPFVLKQNGCQVVVCLSNAVIPRVYLLPVAKV